MTITNLPIWKLKVYGNVSFILVSQVFAYVHFLNFGELKMRFAYRKYILNKFGTLEVSIRFVIWNSLFCLGD